MKLRYKLNTWLSALLALFGFTAFDSCAAMYGVPTVRYDVSGKVTDDKGNPIEGIEVEVRLKRDHEIKSLHAPTASVRNGNGVDNKVLTDEKGRYSHTVRDDDFYEHVLQIGFTDIDGEQNGAYQNDTVRFNKLPRESEDGWVTGGTIEYNATLTEKWQ